MYAVIHRAKLHSPRFMVQWKWTYTVEIPEINLGAAVGERLDVALGYAKRHGATKIVKSWEAVNRN